MADTLDVEKKIREYQIYLNILHKLESTVNMWAYLKKDKYMKTKLHLQAICPRETGS